MKSVGDDAPVDQARQAGSSSTLVARMLRWISLLPP
jgi:hypothetical protein